MMLSIDLSRGYISYSKLKKAKENSYICYSKLKKAQENHDGRDVFAILSAGFGKTLFHVHAIYFR